MCALRFIIEQQHWRLFVSRVTVFVNRKHNVALPFMSCLDWIIDANTFCGISLLSFHKRHRQCPYYGHWRPILKLCISFFGVPATGLLYQPVSKFNKTEVDSSVLFLFRQTAQQKALETREMMSASTALVLPLAFDCTAIISAACDRD